MSGKGKRYDTWSTVASNPLSSLQTWELHIILAISQCCYLPLLVNTLALRVHAYVWGTCMCVHMHVHVCMHMCVCVFAYMKAATWMPHCACEHQTKTSGLHSPPQSCLKWGGYCSPLRMPNKLAFRLQRILPSHCRSLGLHIHAPASSSVGLWGSEFRLLMLAQQALLCPLCCLPSPLKCLCVLRYSGPGGPRSWCKLLFRYN